MITYSQRKFKFPKRDLPKLLNRPCNFVSVLILQYNFTPSAIKFLVSKYKFKEAHL